MPEYEAFNFSQREQLDADLADYCAEQLKSCIAAKGSALMAVSGGNTPKHFFQLLSAKVLPWEKVSITLADERWVSADDEASNERLVRELLLQKNAAKACFIPLKNAADTPEAGQAELTDVLSALGVIDLLILGMGNDGHSASLFPKAPQLKLALDPENHSPCQAITPLTAPHKRMTLTLYWLLQSRDIVLHITGSDKRRVLEQTLKPDAQDIPPIGVLMRASPRPFKIFYAP